MAMDLQGYKAYLCAGEKSDNTIRKYIRDIENLGRYVGENELTRDAVLGWKQNLRASGYKARSINSMLASANSYFEYINRPELTVRNMRIQRHVYRVDCEELNKEEYFRLVDAAENNPRMQLMLQTICATGIRVSELRSFTVEAADAGIVTIDNKGKIREILITDRLRELLLDYACANGIETGPIFRTSSGRPMDRSNIWTGMKRLCIKAGVDPAKVYPHNLRKLFAREFYALDRDIARLADVLGHTNIDTTRIYIMGTGREHREQMEKLNLTR